MDTNIYEIIEAIDDFNKYHKKTIPLCAAENIISPFCKIPLSDNLQERYIMGSQSNYVLEDNFIGSQYLLKFYQLIDKYCKNLFNAKFVDSKTLSGMNCVSTLLMSITNIGDKIVLLKEDSGGHPSIIEICRRLGLEILFAPFDYKNYNLDYENLNKLISFEKPKFICLAPSDIIFPFDIKRIDLSRSILLYDASQLLGLIAGKIIENPLNIGTENIILFGGTHKTLPGPEECKAENRRRKQLAYYHSVYADREKAKRQAEKEKIIAENDGCLYAPKVCEYCDKAFNPTKQQQKYCSEKCSRNAYEMKNKGRDPSEKEGHKYYKRVCTVCGKEYWPHGPNDLTCSSECKHNRILNRHRENYIARKESVGMSV